METIVTQNINFLKKKRSAFPSDTHLEPILLPMHKNGGWERLDKNFGVREINSAIQEPLTKLAITSTNSGQKAWSEAVLLYQSNTASIASWLTKTPCLWAFCTSFSQSVNRFTLFLSLIW
jgi:hypothetical protein